MLQVAPPVLRRFRLGTAALTAALVLAACGSTAQTRTTLTVGQGPAQAGSDGQALTVDPQTGLEVPAGTSAATAAAPGNTVAAGAAGTPGVGAGPSGVRRPGAGTLTVPAGSVPQKGFGWDAKNVYFGVVTQNDAQKAFAAFGANNVDPGDTLGQANAMATYVNAHGGILGRKLVIVPRDVATVDTATNSESVGAQVCTYFTEDHPVIGVLSIVTVMDYPNFRACLAKKRVTLWSSTLKVSDDQNSATLAPYFIQTVMASWTELAPVLVQRLKAQGYFQPWDVRAGAAGGIAPVKVGVLTDSTASGKRIGALLVSELKKAGQTGTVVFNYVNASDGQSNSVQYFQNNNVTHVIVTDVELTAFQNSAASQAYKPRYGISSYNDPYTNLEASGLTPPGANAGAVGVGFAPPLDVSDANDPHATPGTAACQKVMAAGGQQLAGKRVAQVIAYSLCDALNLTALGAGTAHAFAGPAFAQAVAATAPGFASANAFRTAFTTSHLFLPGAARDLAWHPDCSCFRYAAATTGL